MKFTETEGFSIVQNWMIDKGYKPFVFQLNTWERFKNGYSGMVVAPTGFGKTYSVFLAVLIDYFNNPKRYKKGLKLLWVTSLRALSKDIAKAMQEAIDEIGSDWKVEVRNGDTSVKDKQRQTKLMPDILIVTPESFQLLLSQKNKSRFFENISCIAVDEWHELLGTKRGVMTELCISEVIKIQTNVKFTLIKGNHDKSVDTIQKINFHEVISLLETCDFIIRHEFDSECEKFQITGHIHPGVVLKKGLKKMKLPCFALTSNQLLLPAFSLFTGLDVINTPRNAQYFVWTQEKIYAF